MSASRQKNCNTCVQAKRRCDRRTPVCSRCAEKNVTCVYNKSKPLNQRGKHAAPQSPRGEGLSTENPACFPTDLHDIAFDMSYLETIPTDVYSDVVHGSMQSVQGPSSADDMPMNSFVDLMSNIIPSSSSQWLVGAEENQQLERPITPADDEVTRGYDKMVACQLDMPHVYDPKTPLYYVYNRVKGFTDDMATKNSTPFIHPYLYHGYTPQCIVSCFTTCVLYMNRTSANTPMAMRALSSSARDLIDTEGNRVICTPMDKLARSQALFLYQIIRLFDGDIALRAQGERDMGLFRTWLGELCHIRDNLGGLARLEYGSIREQLPMKWEKWIFAECVRRTIILAYAVIGLYELLKDPSYVDPEDPWAYSHRWTLGRSLWEASSAGDFQRAWEHSRHFVITNFTLEHFIEHGKGEDVDEFAEMILKLYMGEDGMEEFKRRDETS